MIFDPETTLTDTLVGRLITTIWAGRWVAREDTPYSRMIAAINLMNETGQLLEEADLGDFFPLLRSLEVCARVLDELRRSIARAAFRAPTNSADSYGVRAYEAVQEAHEALDRAEDELRIWYVDLIHQVVELPAESPLTSSEETRSEETRSEETRSEETRSEETRSEETSSEETRSASNPPSSLEVVHGISPDPAMTAAVREYDLLRAEGGKVQISEELLKANRPINMGSEPIRLIPHFSDTAGAE